MKKRRHEAVALALEMSPARFQGLHLAGMDLVNVSLRNMGMAYYELSLEEQQKTRTMFVSFHDGTKIELVFTPRKVQA